MFKCPRGEGTGSCSSSFCLWGVEGCSAKAAGQGAIEGSVGVNAGGRRRQCPVCQGALSSRGAAVLASCS